MIQYEAVEQACFELLGEGENPSFPKVYQRLGHKGSAKVVQEAIDQWRRSTAERFFARRSHPTLPEPLVAEADRLVDALWHAAIGHVEALLDARLAEGEAQLQREHAAMEAAVRAAEEGARMAGQALAVAQAEIAHRDTRIADLAARLGAETRQHEALEAQTRELREVLAREETARRTAEEGARTQLAAMEATLQYDREQAAEERARLLVQLDESRQAAKSLEARLAAQEKRAEQRERALSERLEAAVERARKAEAGAQAAEARAEQGRAAREQLAEQVTALQVALEAARAQVTDLEKRLAGTEARAVEEFRQAETARAEVLTQVLAERERQQAECAQGRGKPAA
jgi:chromosome segregation ATPase